MTLAENTRDTPNENRNTFVQQKVPPEILRMRNNRHDPPTKKILYALPQNLNYINVNLPSANLHKVSSWAFSKKLHQENSFL